MDKTSEGPWTFKRFQWLLIGLTAVMAILSVVAIVRFVPVVGDNVYPEAAGVVSAQRWAHGMGLYGDYRQAPYLVTAFPPLWYGALASTAKVTRADLDTMTLFGRVLSLACLAGMLALSFLWSRRGGVGLGLAVITPLLLLSFPILVPWAVSARPDFPELFLGVSALYCAGVKPSRRWLIFAAVLAGLAFLVRHNAVAVPTAVVLWLVWSRKWKDAVLFCLVWGVVVGGTLIAFDRMTGGLLLLNLSGAKFGQFAFTYVRDVLGRLLEAPGSGFACILLALGLLGLIESYRSKDNRVLLVSIYFAVSCFFAVLGSAAAGAAVNHLFEPAFALALLAPVGLTRMKAEWRSTSSTAALAFVLVAVVLLPTLDVQRWNVMHGRPDDLRPLVPVVQQTRVFTDIPYLAARSSSPAYLDTASLVYAERGGSQGAWSRDLTLALQEKKYDYVILSAPAEALYSRGERYPRYPHFDIAVKSAIVQNYDSCGTIGLIHVYAPHGAGTGATENCGLSPVIATLRDGTLQNRP